jgi:hypothetical protein
LRRLASSVQQCFSALNAANVNQRGDLTLHVKSGKRKIVSHLRYPLVRQGLTHSSGLHFDLKRDDQRLSSSEPDGCRSLVPLALLLAAIIGSRPSPSNTCRSKVLQLINSLPWCPALGTQLKEAQTMSVRFEILKRRIMTREFPGSG